MPHDNSGSVTHWLDGLKVGDSVAAQHLWDRYFSQLTSVARRRLGELGRDIPAEDVALSALKSVMLGVKENQFPDLADRSGLWPLLVTITARKTIDEMRRRLSQKRGGSAIQQLKDLREVVGREPSPEFALEVADEMERLVLRFDDQILRTVAQRKLEGYTNDEIAGELQVSVRTVIRKLNRIRQEWEETVSNDEGSK